MADNKKTYSEKDVLEAWEQDDKKGSFEIVEVETADEQFPEQTQILSAENGGIVVAVNGTGPGALKRLAENPRTNFLDGALPPKEAVEDGKPRYTKSGQLATPTHPKDLSTFEGLGDVDPADLNPPVEAGKATSRAKK